MKKFDACLLNSISLYSQDLTRFPDLVPIDFIYIVKFLLILLLYKVQILVGYFFNIILPSIAF